MDYSFWNSEPLNFTQLNFNDNSNYGIPFPPPQPMMNTPQTNQYVTSCQYGCMESRSGYIPPPINDITIRQSTFKFDMNLNTWVYEQFNNKGKTNITPVARGIAPNYKLDIEERGELKWNVLIYSVNDENRFDIIPAEALNKGKVAKYVTHINKIPGCSDKLYNELLCFLIRTFPNTKKFTLYPHQGWNFLEGTEVYVQSPDKTDPLFKLVPESVLRRKLAKTTNSTEAIINIWLDMYTKHTSFMVISGLKIGGLLQYFFNSAGFFIQQLFIIEPSENVSADKLTAMLAPNNDPKYPLPTLDSDRETLFEECGYIYDDIAVCIDRTFADEEDKITNNLKDLLKTVIWDNKDEKNSRNVKAVISNNAAYTAVKIAPDNVVVLNMDDVELSNNADEIRYITGQMESYVLSLVQNNFNKVKNYIEFKAKEFSLLVKNLKSESKITANLLLIVYDFLRNFFGINFMDNDTFNKIVLSIDNTENSFISTSQAILNDFANVLSRLIRSGRFTVVKKHKGMQIDSSHDAILDGDRLKIRKESLERILAEMTKTHKKDGLIKALKQTDTINTKDGNTHLLRTHDIYGRNLDLYLYDITAEILDADVLSKLYNPEIMAYTLSQDEIPSKDFMSIIRTENGVAGQKVSFKDAENNHFYITGQSGVGKTYLLSQLVAKRFSLGNKVIIFDSSDSFTYESLCGNLSKRFVDDNVTFHDIDREGIPVDLFRIDRSASLPSQKNQLMGILAAAIGELSSSQSNALRTALSQMLSEISPNRQPQIGDIKSRINGKGATYESLKNRLEPLFDDIKQCHMSDNSWGDFLRNTDKIIVIRTNSLYTGCGNQLIDMMLATLFNYQRENCTTPLDVFIDEIQNQNFSKISPICKIMKEGRKVHLSFFGATQDYYARNTELGSVMGKAGTEIFLRPTSNSESVVAAELRFNKADMARFDSMGRGDIIVKGSLYNKEQDRNISVILCGHVDDYPKKND